MNVYEKIKSMNIEELTDWIDKYEQLDNSPWMEHFNSHYCENCKAIKCKRNEKTELYAYCELHDNCKFFPDIEYIPDNKDIIRMWLETEANKSVSN